MWSGFKGSCYSVVEEKQGRDDAAIACRARGATLAGIKDRSGVSYFGQYVSSYTSKITESY